MPIDSNTFPVDPRIPSDQGMLLKLIDAKFETLTAMVGGVGKDVATLSAAVAQITARYDSTLSDHEHRISEIEGNMKARELQVQDYENTKATVKANGLAISALEKWQTEEQTTTRNATKWGGLIWTAIGSSVTALVAFLIVQFVQVKEKAAHPNTPSVELHSKTVEQTVKGSGH